MNEFIFKSYGNSKQSISYCEVDKCKAVIKLKKCLQEIKEIAKKEVDTRMLFADKESFCDFNKILQKCEVLDE